MHLAFLEPAPLLATTHREPEFEEVNALAHEHAFELRSLAHELAVLRVGAEAHHTLHTRAVVPAAVEEDDLARGGKVLDVALEIPLPALLDGGLLQCDHSCAARIQMFHEALDRTSLAGRVAALEQHDDALPRILHPRLEFQELHLQPVLLPLVVFPRKKVLVGITAFAPVVGQLAVGGPPCEVFEPPLLVEHGAQDAHCVGRIDALQKIADRAGRRFFRSRSGLLDRILLDGRRV